MDLIQFVGSAQLDVSKSVSLLEQIKCSTPEEILFSLTVKMKVTRSLLSETEMEKFQEVFPKVLPVIRQNVEQILLAAKVDFWRFSLSTQTIPPCLKSMISESKHVFNVRHSPTLFGPFKSKVSFYQHSQNVVPSSRCTENCSCKQTQLLIPFDHHCEEKQIQSIEILVLNTEYNDQFLCGAQKMIPNIQCIVLPELIQFKDRLLFHVTQDSIQPGIGDKAIYYLSVLPSFRPLSTLPKPKPKPSS